ncbi:MAG TPA: hypothetical protein VI072_30660 [Polyangiaceae bacterium]
MSSTLNRRSALLSAALLAVACAKVAGIDHDYREVTGGGSGSGSGSSGAAGESGVGGGAGAGAGGDSGRAGQGGTLAGAGGGDGGTEICDNGADDDGDDRRDCFDSDCATATACNGRCSDAVTLPCNVTRTAQATSASGSTQRIAPPDYSCAAGSRAGPELAYRVQGLANAQMFLEIYGLSDNLAAFAVETGSGESCDATTGCISHADDAIGSEPEALAFTTRADRDYYVIVDGHAAAGFNVALHCSTSSTCRPARAIRAGQSINASNVAGPPNVTTSQSIYTCTGGTSFGGPEASFSFTPVVSGTYRIDLTNFNTNLQLFVVDTPNCNTTCSSAATCTRNAASADENCVLTAEAHKTYFIVVEGFGSATFTLAVTQQ